MIPVRLEEIARLALGVLEGGEPGDSITGVKADSREVGRGDLFVALNTGVRFVDEARARGAITLVPHDQERALAAIARLVRERSDAQVVAVVGSAGKTTTKDILGALLLAARSDDLGREEPEQRDRPAAHGVPARARDGGADHRDGDARARPDRRALHGRATEPRRRAPHRPGAPRAPRHRRARGRSQRRGDRVAAAGGHCRRAGARGRARATSRPHRHRPPPVRPGGHRPRERASRGSPSATPWSSSRSRSRNAISW